MAHRDPHTDHLLTPQNSAIVLIDYQPGLIEGTRSISHDNLLNNAIATAKTAAMYAMPTIVSTIVSSARASRHALQRLVALHRGQIVQRRVRPSERHLQSVQAPGRQIGSGSHCCG